MRHPMIGKELGKSGFWAGYLAKERNGSEHYTFYYEDSYIYSQTFRQVQIISVPRNPEFSLKGYPEDEVGAFLRRRYRLE